MELKLNKLEKFSGSNGPLLLVIMDGVGFGRKDESDAVHLAKTPNLDKLLESKLQKRLTAHGPAVGLPSDDDMGNSEVGHQNIGAGRVVYQDSVRITVSIRDGEFFENEELLKAIEHAKLNKGKLHLMGLCSDLQA